MNLAIERDDLMPGRNLVGRWCEAQDGRRFEVTDPATDAVFATVPDSGAADALAALEAAHAAFGRRRRRFAPRGLPAWKSATIPCTTRCSTT
jgi:succinate-semialdehyde dehydrogenase/glutarate-semialdehyde dehydrogenase